MIKKESLNKLKINCRSHLEDYKTVIGAVLLRLPGVSTVVNKSSSIDNTFRNFRWVLSYCFIYCVFMEMIM